MRFPLRLDARTPPPFLALRNRPPHPHALLPRIQPLLLQLNNLRPFLHDLLSLRQDEFDMAWIRHVRVNLLSRYTYISKVCGVYEGKAKGKERKGESQHTRPWAR